MTEFDEPRFRRRKMHRRAFRLLRSLSLAFFTGALFAGAFGLSAMTTSAQSHPTYPTRDPHTAGYVKAAELPDGANAPADKDGNFILGPTHVPAPEMAAPEMAAPEMAEKEGS